MLKKLILVAAVCASAFGSLEAAVVNKSPQEVKIYINPGHGGWNGNCRPMGTVKHGENVTTATTANDTTAFFESNTNLWKCLAMYYKLLDYGVPGNDVNALYDSNKEQHIVMSRIANGNDTDRGLSTDIAVEVEKFKPDVFISVHSNASPDGTIGSSENYPLVIYRGEDYRSSAFADTKYGKNWDYAGGGFYGDGSSYELGKLVYSHLAAIEHEPYTNEWPDQYVSYSGYTPLKTEHNVRGDVSLRDYFNYLNNGTFTFNSNRGSGTTNSYSKNVYYGYYGVMKHGAVGVLSEGYMHSYYPSTNRHMNKDVCAIEGIAYAHAIADYFGWEKEKIGYIYGIVRDRNQTFSHTYYIANQNTDDKYKPLNNCTVKLYKDGELVDTYVTDDEYNGAFVFYDLEPGDYTLDYECDGYQPASEGLKSTVVTVKANEISYPKAFLNAEGYSLATDYEFALKSDISDWHISFADHSTYPGSKYLQAGVSNDIFYTVPAPTATSDMHGTYYTKGWIIKDGTLTYFSGGSGSVYGSSGSYYYAGPAVAADADGTLWTAAHRSTSAPSEYPWADDISRLIYWNSTDGFPTGNTSGGKKHAFALSSAISARSDLMTAYGHCLTGEGSLWFCLMNTNSIERVIVKGGVYDSKVAYTTPSAISSQNSRSTCYQYVDNKVCYAPGVQSPTSTNYQSIYKGIISGNSISWTDLGVKSYSPCATMFELNGHEILAYSSSTTNVTIRDITAGKDIATITPWASASANAYVQHSLSSKVNGDGTAYLYVYVPGRGAARYTILTSAVPTEGDDDPCENVEVATTEMTNYEQSIKVTWDKPDSWNEEPTNYLVQYRMYYTKDDGTIQYLNANGNFCTSEDWQVAGMTEGASCSFVHEGVEFAHDGSSKIYPLTYSYRIIPNFNCYDGEASAITTEVVVNFVAPEPTMNAFAITAQHDGKELKQYDGTVTWNGVDFTANNQFSLEGYKFELYSSKDTYTTPIVSFEFNVDDAKYFGAIDSNTGEGVMFDATGNAIENLFYSVADGVYTFKYNTENLDVLDMQNGEPNTYIFRAHVSALFDIEGEFVYSGESIKKIQPYAYELKEPGMSDVKVSTFTTDRWSEDGEAREVHWVEMNLSKPDFGTSEAMPVSYYLISMDKDKDGKADEYVTEMYVYDAVYSLGLMLETGSGIKDNAIIKGVSTMSMRSTTAPAQLPGTYAFDQAIPSDEYMVSFPVLASDDEDPKHYHYTVEAVYAAENTEITSVTYTTVENPIDGGVTTEVETLEIDGNEVLNVYPVPATISVTVKASEAIEKIAIYSESGTLVKSIEGNGECVMTIPVSDLYDGVYFFCVNTLTPIKVFKK